jgi:hypothetical protein
MWDKIGYQGFIWFFGIVEDVNDPLQLGRVRVRIYNIHSFDEARVRKEDLPWAHIIMPASSASFNSVGVSPNGLLVNSTIFGFFADGEEQQKPMILGTLPGIPQPNPEDVDPNNIVDDNHDVSKLARGNNKLAAEKNRLRAASKLEDFEPPPESSFGARYPHNKVFETENGIAIEIDDTPGAQRIHIWHPGGSYTEINNGFTIHKTNGTEFQICAIDKQVKVKGNYVVDIEGNYIVNATGDIIFNTGRSFSLNANTTISTRSNLSTSMSAGAFISMTAVGYASVKAGAYLSLAAGGFINVKSGAGTAFVSGAVFSVNAGAQIAMTSGVSTSIGSTGPTYMFGNPVLLY